MAGLAPRRLPRPGAAGPGAQRRRPRPLARRRAASPSVSTVPTLAVAVAARLARGRPPADLRRRGVPARARRRASPSTAARSGTPTARPRPRSWRAAPGSPARGPCGSACPSTVGTWPWSTATVEPVDEGEVGELIIGGVGLARYLDPVKDAEKFAPMPTLGWERAYRSGDLVRYEPEGLLFVGRADDQVKVGGRRIELGEIDAALQALPGVAGAAAAVRQTDAGHPILVGYLVMQPGRRARPGTLAPAAPRRRCPPRWSRCSPPSTTLPTRTSGKVDRDALPWPLPRAVGRRRARPAAGGHRRLGRRAVGPRARHLARRPATRTSSTSAGAASPRRSWSTMLRERYPEVTVADVYEQPTLGALADRLAEFEPPVSQSRIVVPTPRRAQAVQLVLTVPLFSVVGAPLAHLDRARQRRAAPPGHAHLGAAGVVVGGGARADRVREPRRTDRRWRPLVARLAAARRPAGQLPARRWRPPAAVVRRGLARRRRCRATSPARRG